MGDTTAKVALITGANKGIGLETALQLGKLGVTVLMGARDLDKGERAAEGLRGFGVDARAVKLDVVSETDRHELYQRNAPQVEAGLYLVPRVIE